MKNRPYRITEAIGNDKYLILSTDVPRVDGDGTYEIVCFPVEVNPERGQKDQALTILRELVDRANAAVRVGVAIGKD